MSDKVVEFLTTFTNGSNKPKGKEYVNEDWYKLPPVKEDDLPAILKAQAF